VEMGDILQRWALLIPALAGLGMYALVHVQPRYIGGFVILLWADLLRNVRLPNHKTSRRLMSLVSIAMLLVMLLNVAAFGLEGLGKFTGRVIAAQPDTRQASPPSWPGEVAEALHGLGIRPGTKVAVIGYAFDSFWARLARVQIVAEMLGWEADPFWLGDPTLQSEVLHAFASTGAEAIVAEHVPGYATLSGWHRIGDSDYYVYVLE
jgi:hypothetical protein